MHRSLPARADLRLCFKAANRGERSCREISYRPLGSHSLAPWGSRALAGIFGQLLGPRSYDVGGADYSPAAIVEASVYFNELSLWKHIGCHFYPSRKSSVPLARFTAFYFACAVETASGLPFAFHASVFARDISAALGAREIGGSS